MTSQALPPWEVESRPVLGTGTLTKSEAGMMTGTASFAVRGDFPMTLEAPSQRSGVWYARLKVGRDQCEVMRVPVTPPGVVAEMPDGAAEHWHGFIDIEGYNHRVRTEPGNSWSVGFHDWTQPYRGEFAAA